MLTGIWDVHLADDGKMNQRDMKPVKMLSQSTLGLNCERPVPDFPNLSWSSTASHCKEDLLDLSCMNGDNSSTIPTVSAAWPKCPALTSDPIFIIDQDSTLVLLPGWNDHTEFEYLLFGSTGLIKTDRLRGHHFKIGNKYGSSPITSLDIRRLCGDVASRRFQFLTPSPKELLGDGAYYKSYNQCLYVKSLLDAKGFILYKADGHQLLPEKILEKAGSSARFDDSNLPDLRDIFISSDDKPNLLYRLKESNLALEGFRDFQSAESIVSITNEIITHPFCLEATGSIRLELVPKTQKQLYFSIDQGKTWFPEPNFENVEAGSHRILVREGLESCLYEIPQAFTIDSSRHLAYSGFVSNPGSNCQNLKGSIHLEVKNPESIHYFINDSPYVGPDFLFLVPGFYDIKMVLKDNPECVLELKQIQVKDEFLLSESVLKIKNASGCEQADGEIKIDIANNNFEFSLDNGAWQNNSSFTGLTPGKYTVSLRSKNGECANLERTVEVRSELKNWPIELAPEVEILNVKCHGEQSGSLTVQNAPGNGETYLWHQTDGQNLLRTFDQQGERLPGIGAGNYRLDYFPSAFCYVSYNYAVAEPEKFEIENPVNAETVILCEGSSIQAEPNFSGLARIEWYFEEKFLSDASQISVSEPGKYALIASNDALCRDTAFFEVKSSGEVFSPDFLFPSIGLLGDTLVGVDVSLINADDIQWVLPSGALLVGEGFNQVRIQFMEMGTFSLQMKATKGSCESTIEKQIQITDDAFLVLKDNARQGKIFVKFMVYPNPNSGEFSVEYELSQALDTRINVYDQLGNSHFNKSVSAHLAHKEELDLTNLNAGVYIVMVNTSQAVQLGSFIIRK